MHYGWLDGWMNGWMDGWMDGWNRRIEKLNLPTVTLSKLQI